MPQILRSIDDIMREAGRDTAFVKFGSPFDPSQAADAARQRHLAWFHERGIRTEAAAPRGWLEGDPFIVAVHFDGPDDPRIAEYSAAFEDASGISLDPEAYQMFIWPHAGWRESYEAYLKVGGVGWDDP